MRVLVIKPNQVIEVVNIKDTDEALNELVGGWIEMVHIPCFREREVCILVNEEGLLLDLKPSVVRVDRDYDVIDNLVGNIVFTGTVYDAEEGPCFSDITDSQIAYVRAKIEDAEIDFTLRDGSKAYALVMD